MPYGRRLRRGWLVDFAGAAPVEEVRSLVAVLAEAPAVTAAQVAMARWVSRRTNTGIARSLAIAIDGALAAALPRLHLARGRAAELEAAGAGAARLLSALKKAPVRLDRAWALLPAGATALLPDLLAAGTLVRLPPSAPAAGRRPEPAAGQPETAPLDRPARELCRAVFADITNARGGIFVATAPSWPQAVIEQLVQHTRTRGKQTLILLPHPSSGNPNVRAVVARFPDSCIVSGASGVGAVAAARPDLTIGGRWAPLATFADLGLVIVGDEHDPIYAGDRPPYLHGRELALQAARLAGATSVLLSPNPDPATLWRASRAGVRRFTLSTVAPVQVEMVDLRQEMRAGRGTLISDPLRTALAATLAAGEQAILFLNRRGAAMLTCRRCGVTLQCHRCSVALVYHPAEASVRCHCCNSCMARPAVCPGCRRPTLDELGAGVQRVMQELHQAYPAARLARWDRDSVPDAASGRLLARRFTQREVDVLVGTQAVIQAASLPSVALAAAVLADLGLQLPDYRAAERSYELLSALQRRVAPGGRLILQAYHPAHWVLQALAAGDPALYYGEELRVRRELGYPPFRQLVRLTCRASSRQRGEAEALRLRAALKERLAEVAPEVPDALLGPAPAYVERARGVYRWQLHVRAPNVQPLLSVVPPHWIVEVDPEELR